MIIHRGKDTGRKVRGWVDVREGSEGADRGWVGDCYQSFVWLQYQQPPQKWLNRVQARVLWPQRDRNQGLSMVSIVLGEHQLQEKLH